MINDIFIILNITIYYLDSTLTTKARGSEGLLSKTNLEVKEKVLEIEETIH